MPTRNTQYFITAVRHLTNMEEDPIVTDDEITDRVNEGIAALYDILIGTYEHYAVRTYSFSLVGGVGQNTAPLPPCFYKDVSLDLNPTTNPSTVHRFASWVERNNLRRLSYIVEGSSIVVGPAQIAKGDYMLTYTPLPPVMAVSTSIDMSTGINGVDGTLNSWSFANATFTQADVGSVLTVSGAVNAINNGSFLISEVISATDIVTGGYTLASEAFASTVVATYYPLGTIDVLPQIFVPWYEYIQVHAAIAVKDKIEQDTADLEARLQRLQARVTAAASNRMEEGGQIALVRGGGGFWNDDFFGGGSGW